jgi:hypothetical protein
MSDYLVHEGAMVQCTHNGSSSARPNTSNARVKVSRQRIVTQEDSYIISNCPNPAAGGGPCTTARWVQVATRVRAGKAPVVLKNSHAKCLPVPAELIVGTTQTRVKGT